ncbi:MAG TPA: GNAT family N-acetyltransferase [Chloroflexota bacterium]|nr:GNAT family N-acetyltransferase [Chloroflexota bacterium]
MGKAIVRPATAADIPRVLPLVEKTYLFHDALDRARFGAIPGGAEKYHGWLSRLVDSDDGVFLVAELDGRLAGFTIGVMQSDARIYKVQRIGFIHDLWVDEDVRRQGIARELVSKAIARFEALGAEQVRLDTAGSNEVARTLFTSLGFRPSVVEMLKGAD